MYTKVFIVVPHQSLLTQNSKNKSCALSNNM